MTLRQKQVLFSRLMPRLIDKIYADGYECTFGDFWSKPEYHAHSTVSKHYRRLAADINLFKDGAYLDTTEAHKPFGEFWESLDPLCQWGGRFNDGNHYELKDP